ncbi:MAG: hypothetical protein ABSE92_14565 [Terriglobales bacterium]
MTKLPRQGAFSGSPRPHLNEAQLIAYLDGELGRPEREASRDHLETCWTCRGLLGEIESSIDAFLDIRTSLLPEESTFSETRVEQFRQRLARHASSIERGPVPLGNRLAALWTHTTHAAAYLVQPRQAAVAGFLVVTMLVIMFTDALNTRVSADTVLARASQYEAEHLPAQGQVSRTSMRVERIDHKAHAANGVRQLGTITIVRDSIRPKMYVRAEASSGKSAHAVMASDEQMSEDVLEVLLAPEDSTFEQYVLHQRWQPDLSASQFERLGAVQGSALSARKDQGELDVSYRFAGNPSGITEAMLQVNPSDYAPSSISFVTADQDAQHEYRFTRTAFSVEPRTLEIAELFVPSAAVTETTTAEARKLPALSKPVPVAYGQSHATPEEVAVAAALHKSDACLGEEIYIFPMSDGTLLVQGLVDNSTRREAIVRTLKPLAHNVRIEIYLPREIKSGSDLYNPPEQFSEKIPGGLAGDQAATLADLSSGQSPLYERLNQHFSQSGVSREDANKQVDVFSSEMVTIARQTFLHAWALKRLDGEFSNGRIASLSDSELREIDQMRQDHRRWIATLARRESEMLAPIAGPAANESSAAAPDNGADTDTLLALARTQNDLVRALFADSRQAAQADTNLSRLLAVIHRMGS